MEGISFGNFLSSIKKAISQSKSFLFCTHTKKRKIFFIMKEELASNNFPKHVAIMMDGNRRWAKKNKLPVFWGHKEGAQTLIKIVRAASKMGVKILTVYAFSTENWTRSKAEVGVLMNLLHFYLMNQKKTMIEEGVRLDTIGDIAKLPKRLQNVLAATKEATKEGKEIDLVLALNYGGRDEIVRSCTRICEDVKKNILSIKAIDEETFANYLDTHFIPDPDLVIRTSGEKRISNFLLWQISYSELVFTDVLWPDFKEEDLKNAIIQYQKRERRLGGNLV